MTGVKASFNISGVEDRGEGNYRIPIMNDMRADATYSFALSRNVDGSTHIRDSATYAPKNWFEIETRNSAGTLTDYVLISAIIFGD